MPARAEPARGPVRTCIGCRRVAPVHQLVRVGRTADGTLRFGRTLHGRGAWLCQGSRDCFEQAIRRGGFARAFRTAISPSHLDALRAETATWGDGGATDFVPGTPPARD